MLSDQDQIARQIRAARACRRDGTSSLLVVNTRLQVEHSASEEGSGIDLVRDQFRLADGEALSYSNPQARGTRPLTRA